MVKNSGEAATIIIADELGKITAIEHVKGSKNKGQLRVWIAGHGFIIWDHEESQETAKKPTIPKSKGKSKPGPGIKSPSGGSPGAVDGDPGGAITGTKLWKDKITVKEVTLYVCYQGRVPSKGKGWRKTNLAKRVANDLQTKVCAFRGPVRVWSIIWTWSWFQPFDPVKVAPDPQNTEVGALNEKKSTFISCFDSHTVCCFGRLLEF